MNLFRLIGDLAHISSKCILVWAIHRNKSAEGISALTQGMYSLVFCTRYLDLFWAWISLYNTIVKIFYLASSFYILFIMLRVYPYTRESHKAYGITVYSVAGSMIIAPPVVGFAFGWSLIFSRFGGEVFWTFSIILESICVLPQLVLLRQTTVPTVIDSYYLLALGSYRGFYILNWIYRWFTEGVVDPIAVTFGIIQTALYVDFAWVYYGRQRIKLRAGALIDSQDYGRGWLVGRLVGREAADLEHGDVDGIFDADSEEGRGREEGGIALPPDAPESAPKSEPPRPPTDA
ncbi:ER lumen protein retaining receptor-domain-containing protein [Mucidula mucida]|nr:ER lumen protein retaining receptor-domain-containing protein [Mucidula mucida]